MPVEIKIFGDLIEHGVGAEECAAALDLKKCFEDEFTNKSDVNGLIVIKPNFKAIGYNPEDIDLVVWMNFNNYTYNLFTGYQYIDSTDKQVKVEPSKTKQNVQFSSMLLNIELKSHNRSGIELTNTDLKVKYKGKLSSAIDQNTKQKFSLVNFIKINEPKLAEHNPRVNNLVWLPNIEGNLPWGCSLNNVILGNVTYKKLIEIAFAHEPPFKAGRNFYKSSFNEQQMNDNPDELLENLFSYFDKVIKLNQGDYSRKKLERVVQRQLENNNQEIFDQIGSKTTIITGVPGSGKTINLLHFAYHLAKNKGQRCLILTYNKALMADIERLSVLSGFKDDPSSATIGTNTCMRLMRSFLIEWDIYSEPVFANKNDKMNYFRQHFLNEYESLLNKLLEYLKIAGTEDINEVKKTLPELNWQTIFIDESQDWYPQERDILYRLFHPNNFVISYGSYQLIRNHNSLYWNENIESSQRLNLLISYRQKSNLCHYIRDISDELNLKDEIKVNQELNGGKINIYTRPLTVSDYNHYNNYCINECKNASYDILLLVNSDDNFLKLLKQNSIAIHNGTIEKNKGKIPTDMDKCRVFNYQSCRGLEGWVLIANNLDLFLETVANRITEALPMMTLAETKRKAVAQWLYMILSRPIDALVISLHNTRSEYSQLLLRVASEKSDYCEII